MKYWFLILSFTLPSFAWSSENDLAYFDTYLVKHERQMTAGKWLVFSSIPVSLLGAISLSAGMTTSNIDTIEQDATLGLMTSGYVFIGVGLLMACIGLPLWIWSTNEYYHILERRERYFLMTR